MIFADGRIVAHLRIWDRALRVRGAELLAAGIGSLCTHPDYRGRGYAKARFGILQANIATYRKSTKSFW